MAKPPKYIKETTYEIDAHTKPGQFVIPKEVLDSLGLTTADPVRLVIRNADNPAEILYEGSEVYMGSGPEVYGPKIKAVVTSKQRLRVTVSRVD